MTPVFSIIMPSYLGEYRGAAKDRERKFLRAVQSVLEQTATGWELIIVADGCRKTTDLYQEWLQHDPRILCFRIPKAETWCPSVRNAGLFQATGTWACYLDTDDYWGTRHLEFLREDLRDYDGDWAWFDAWYWNGRAKAFTLRPADITKCAGHGTANIVHRVKDGLLWPLQRRNRQDRQLDYGTQDCAFVDVLKTLHGGKKIMPPEYFVCHLPSHVAGAYDV